jgi:hypothetical protein
MAYNPNNPNGQATMANSAPVVIASDQSSIPVNDNGGSITVDGTVAVSNFPATQPISGTVTVQQATAGNLNATVVGSVSATQSGTWNINDISGTISLPTGAATETTLSAVNTKIPSGLTVTSTRLLVDGSGVTQPISGTVAATQSGTWNINNISGTISLPTGAATETTLSTLNGKVPANLTVSATRLLVDGSGVTQPVSGTVNANISGSISNTSFAVTQATAANLNATVVGTGTFAVQAAQSGTWNVGLNAGTNYVGRVRLTDGTTDAEVVPLANYNAQAVAIVDGSGNQVTSFGGGTQYADGTAVATPTGTVSLGFDGTNVQALSTTAAGLLNIADGGGSITIDGTVAATQSGSWSVTNLANSGVDIGDVTINNAAGASAVNIQDGGNSITIDGSVGLNAGTNYVGRVRLTDGTTDAEVVPLTGFNAQAVAVVDGNGNQILNFGTQYLDGTTVGTPTGTVMLGFDGVDVQAVKALSTGELVITGDVPHDSPDAGDPVKIGFQAETALPTAVANGDRANGISDRYGRQLVAHIDPGMQTWKSAEYTTTQTGTNIWVPTAGRRFVVTQLNIATGGTTAGLVTIWAAQTATTAYTPGTDQVFFRGTLTPTANATPGALIQPPYPMFSDTLNDCLKITTSANMTIYIQVYGYEITP